MSDEPKPQPEETPEPASPSPSPDEQDIGDFITRNVLEKDSVFFEG